MADCSSEEGSDSSNCSLVLRIGSVSLQHGPVTVNCSGAGCSAALSNPPWDTWLRVEVESRQDNRTVSFSVVSNYTGDHRKAATHLIRTDHDRIKIFYLDLYVCVPQWDASQQVWASQQTTTSTSSVATAASLTRPLQPTVRRLHIPPPLATNQLRRCCRRRRVCGTSPCCTKRWMFCRSDSLQLTGPMSALPTHTRRCSPTRCTHRPLVVHSTCSSHSTLCVRRHISAVFFSGSLHLSH